MQEDVIAPPNLVQVAMCTTSIARSVEFLTRVVGFGEAHSDILYGPGLAQMQRLGPDCSCVGWWLVGRQEFLQIEFFQHQLPEQRPLPSDWAPNVQGWVRWGVAVPDFDTVVERLKQFGLVPFTEPMTFVDGLRRLAVHEPGAGTVIEIIEEGPALSGGVRSSYFSYAPAILYTTLVVPDVTAALAFWTGALGMRDCGADHLHSPDMEVLWGLQGAARKTAVVATGNTFIELVEYLPPFKRPPRSDYRLSDQGMQNIGLGYRERDKLDTLVARLERQGLYLNTPLGPHNGFPTGSYTTTPEGFSLEVLTILSDYDPYFGFRPKPVSPVKAMLDDIKT